MAKPKLTAARPIATLLVASLTLAACQQDPAAEPEVVPQEVVTAVPLPSGTPPSPATAATTAESTTLPPPLVPESEKGEKGARNILLAFGSALENRHFSDAYAMLGRPLGGPDEAQFMQQWGDLDHITVSLPVGTVEGGAGSLYYETRAEITAQDPDGRPLRFEGPITLRRVNDVDGATPAQLRWHFSQFDVVQTH